MSKKYLPTADHVLVKPLSRERVSAGGIHIPDTASDAGTLTGEVVAVGPGARLENGSRAELSLRVGDHVLYVRNSGYVKLDVNGVEHALMHEAAVICVVQDA